MLSMNFSAIFNEVETCILFSKKPHPGYTEKPPTWAPMPLPSPRLGPVLACGHVPIVPT